MRASLNPQSAIGRSPDHLSLDELRAWTGWWIALEVYTPATTPLRTIEALERTPAASQAALRRRGLDPRNFEIVPLRAPF